jgi:hypothetical protein
VAFTVASNFLALVQQQEQLRVQRENLAAQEAQEKQIKASSMLARGRSRTSTSSRPRSRRRGRRS